MDKNSLKRRFVLEMQLLAASCEVFAEFFATLRSLSTKHERSLQPYEAFATKGSLAFIFAASCGTFGVVE